MSIEGKVQSNSMRTVLNILVASLLAIVPLGMVGCGADNGAAPIVGDEWDFVRFHQESGSAAGEYQDLTLQPSGALWLETGRRGGASSARGLLAGERLETLARLIDELPLDPYRGSADCTATEYFISVTRRGVVSTYTTTACDLNAPAALESLRGLFDTVITEVREPRLAESDSYRSLASGVSSAIANEKRLVIENVDTLIRVLRAHDPNGLVGIPNVDFKKQVVIAEFLGQRASGGYNVAVEFVEVSEAGWTTVHYTRSEPSAECEVTLAETQPFHFLAIDRPDTGFLFDAVTTVTRCD